jgi:hypothetical protein
VTCVSQRPSSSSSSLFCVLAAVCISWEQERLKCLVLVVAVIEPMSGVDRRTGDCGVLSDVTSLRVRFTIGVCCGPN